MLRVIKHLPKDVPTCEYHKEKAVFYIEFMVQGRDYYFPVTKETMKCLGIEKVPSEDAYFIEEKHLSNLDELLRDFVWAVHLQIREEFSEDILSILLRKVEDGFAKLFEPGIKSEVNLLVKKAMPDLQSPQFKEYRIADDYYHELNITCPNCGKLKLESNLIDHVICPPPAGCQVRRELNSFDSGHPISMAVADKRKEIENESRD